MAPVRIVSSHPARTHTGYGQESIAANVISHKNERFLAQSVHGGCRTVLGYNASL